MLTKIWCREKGEVWGRMYTHCPQDIKEDWDDLPSARHVLYKNGHSKAEEGSWVCAFTPKGWDRFGKSAIKALLAVCDRDFCIRIQRLDERDVELMYEDEYQWIYVLQDHVNPNMPNLQFWHDILDRSLDTQAKRMALDQIKTKEPYRDELGDLGELGLGLD